MSVKLRQELERKIALRVINDGLKYGYKISVNDGEEETLTDATDADKILAAMFTTDEDWLIFSQAGKKNGWVRFIYGNDGWDVVNDYTTNLEHVMKGANELADQYA